MNYMSIEDSELHKEWCNFWGRDRNCTFFGIRVFSPFMQSPKSWLPSGRKWAGEEKRIWSTCERSEHGSFSPLVFSTSGGVGPTANVDYERSNSLNDCPETWQDKQQDTPLDQIQTELLTPALSNYVPKSSEIQHSPPCNNPRHNVSSLPQRSGPSTVSWTHKHSNPLYNYILHLLYLHLIYWMNFHFH